MGLNSLPQDLRAWCIFNDVARQIDRHDVFEYWRSSPYPLNLMEQHNYQIRVKFQGAVERKDPAVASALASGQGLLDWDDIRAYRQVDPVNAKLRGLSRDVLGRGAWRLAWLPPSLPYYQLAGAYADPDLRSFTKRLIFSAWTVVPKAIAVLMSYEAERLAVSAAGLADRGYDHTTSPPLQFRMADNRVASMPVLALLYPSLTLAREGDPLEIARRSAANSQSAATTSWNSYRAVCACYWVICRKVHDPVLRTRAGTGRLRFFSTARWRQATTSHSSAGCANGTHATRKTLNHG